MDTTSSDIERLNADCVCVTLDRDALARAFDDAVGEPGFHDRAIRSRPGLLSAQPLFLSAAHAQRMADVIAAVEWVARLPQYQQAVLPEASTGGQMLRGPVGAFMGYDFHLGAAGPKLIEINTNAGGALINAFLAQAQRACCAEMGALEPGQLRKLEQAFIDTFRAEWRLQRGDEPLRTVAIVDDAPAEQYLFPKFVLFERLLSRHGITARIADARKLEFRDGALWSTDGLRIDLVYNRLTDFDLSEPHHRALRDAYAAGAVVLTPNPRIHALLANKRNLALLGDESMLRSWAVPEVHVQALANGIPHTERVAPEAADALWARRSKLFFKPNAGYGSKAAYRGDKVTRRVWSEILAGDYVAQELVPPSQRAVAVDGERQTLKVDLRNYVYDGAVQLVAARLYSGQATNFRTPGGGFAPVIHEQGTLAPGANAARLQPCT